MELYNYSNLLITIGEIKTNKIMAENERIMNKRNKLFLMENNLKSSGILDDWYDLKNDVFICYGKYKVLALVPVEGERRCNLSYSHL